MLNLRDVEILECTLRDGSYAIDFNFTSFDTSLLTKKISNLGFNWIEIGHGLGLGASQSGKGIMPHDDFSLLKAAKSSTEANIGMFYIPALSSHESLKEAVDLGLDFVRIGANATEADEVLPDIAYAKKLGLTVGMNFMKSYSVTAAEYGVMAKNAVDAGADIIYLVDSVGGMTPAEVELYYNETKRRCNCELGFHGHDNLKMAVANTLKAYECGARFLDATIMGIGRGAGNAASEALACLLEEDGVDTGIDVVELLNVADTYVAPLLKNLPMYNTKEVAMGYGKMHSSHMPMIMGASRKYNADEKQLIIKMGKIDPVDIDATRLDEEAARLKDTKNVHQSLDLVSYPGLDGYQDQIFFDRVELDEFVKGISVTAAKRKNALPVLEVVYTGDENDDYVAAECVWDSDNIVLGRITSGGYDALIEAARRFTGMDYSCVVDPGKSRFSESVLQRLIDDLGADRTYTIDLGWMKVLFSSNVLCQMASRLKCRSLVIYGNNKFLVDHLLNTSFFDQIYVVDPEPYHRQGVVPVTAVNDWVQLNMTADLIYIAEPPNRQTLDKLLKATGENGRIINPHNLYEFKPDSRMIHVDLNSAYEGVAHQIKMIADTI
ncbi:hypothetical protein [Desulfovibrio sp. JC010]|uniref:hypothetical protein n=1 Tax=Desulfovibrio sp. JC010 TaxID=2593641 RepID=UPI0013D4E7C9|nr:hypothetical protein [Desulfovibrio sp. JC010]